MRQFITKNPSLKLRALVATAAFQSSLQRGWKERKGRVRSDNLQVTHLYSSSLFSSSLAPRGAAKLESGTALSPVSFLQKRFLLLKPSEWENGNSSSSPGVICHAASEISQALLW